MFNKLIDKLYEYIFHEPCEESKPKNVYWEQYLSGMDPFECACERDLNKVKKRTPKCRIFYFEDYIRRGNALQTRF